MSADVVDVEVLAGRIQALAVGHPRALVGIDGPGGSGKSTFAKRLVNVLDDACVVHVDDFYLPSSLRQSRVGEVGPWFDLPRLADQVILPAASGRAFRYQRYDWATDALAEWVDVPCGATVVVEGVFCLAAQLRAAYTFTVWCTAPLELRLARGLSRDGKSARSMWVDLWMPAEDEYLLSQQPDAVADVVLDSSTRLAGAPVFRVAAGKAGRR